MDHENWGRKRASAVKSSQVATNPTKEMNPNQAAPQMQVLQERALTGLEPGAVQVWLRQLMVEVFQIEEDIDDRRPFFEIGMTSMNAGRFVARINAEFQMSLETADIFDVPTVQSLAMRILKEAGTGGRVATGDAPASVLDSGAMSRPPVNATQLTPTGASGTPQLDAILDGIAGDTLDVERALSLLNS